ncbi:MAG: uracil-DNA glycosylase [Rickettsiales bacterium]|jgi:DNA polymerase|nr:uracil-DNA glycosylase [Rickettsiales bacterium]
MAGPESILKSLALAGVEWELCEQVSGNREQVSGANVEKKGIIPEPNSPSLANTHWQLPKATDGVVEKIGERGSATPASTNFVAPSAPVSSAAVATAAGQAAGGESDLATAIKNFTIHPLAKGAKNPVPPLLNANCSLLVITDIPSAADDASGKILSGPEGELFDKMMSAIGLARTQISITPLVFWRPAGGRTPTEEELAGARPFVDAVLAAHPNCKILTLGALAAKTIAGATLPRDHGKPFDRVIPIYKPDYILANPGVKGDVWNALKSIKE